MMKRRTKKETLALPREIARRGGAVVSAAEDLFRAGGFLVKRPQGGFRAAGPEALVDAFVDMFDGVAQ